MLIKNRSSSNNGINNPLPTSDFFISEGDRLFGENFATGEYYRRKQENEKRKERYKFRQSQTNERERRRWERIDYEYLRKENQNMVNKEKNLVGRKNNPGMAFNPLNLQYDNSVQGEILKRRDEESKYRAWMRSLNIDKHSNAGYNIINGEERTILEERLNKDIVPDLIQKNMQQINEMKNKVFNNNRNFFTSVNRNNSPQTGQYRYDNNNNNFNYMNRMNKSTTPNIMPNDGFNRNGGRYREPVEYRNDFNNGNNLDMNNNMNNFNREESKNMIYPRNNSSNNMMNNNYGNYNNNNYMSPPPQKQRLNQEMQYENNNMERNNNNMNDRFNNFNGNNVTPNTLNNNMNNNINDNYGNNNQIRNMSPVNNNELNQNLPYNNYGVNPYNPYSRQDF